MIAPLKSPYDTDDTQLLALCVWREARGESPDAKFGVACVIQNRIAMAPAQGFKSDVRGNILKPWAFSSFMDGDPNSTKYPNVMDASWLECLNAAQSEDPDNTGGAVFYFSPPLTDPPHAWGPVRVTAVIDHLTFCVPLSTQ